jgi:hypothetical protein
MLRAYVEFVHPYMPLLDLHDFLTMVDRRDGSKGKVSLILFQAVMFAGSAFVDMEHLRTAGYATRKDARKDFFQRTRVSLDPLSENLGKSCASADRFHTTGVNRTYRFSENTPTREDRWADDM